MTLTSAELLREWKLRQGLAPLRGVPSGSVVTRSDGYDVDSLLTAQINAWYLRYVSEAVDVSSLPADDISEYLSLTVENDGTGLVVLPKGCLRVVSVEMDGWERAAEITSPGSRLWRNQLSPFTRGRCVRPVAVVSGRKMSLYTPVPGASGLEVKAVMLPGSDSYRLTPQMLAAMPVAIAPLNQPI